MSKLNKLTALLIMVCMLVGITPMVPCHAATILHVGEGQTYDGNTDTVIQQAINDASYGDTILLHYGTYFFYHQVNLKSGITIKGETGNTTIYAYENTCNKTLSTVEGEDEAYFHGAGVSDIEICNLTFRSDSSSYSNGGKGQKRVAMWFRKNAQGTGCSNVTVHHISAPEWQYCDFFRCNASNNMIMHDCDVITGHAAAYFFNCTNSKVYNNNIKVYINAGIRNDGSTNCEYYNNTIWCGAGGQAAFELQNNCEGVNMHDNLVYDFAKATSSKSVVQNEYSGGGAYGNVSFHDNVYWNCPGGVEVTAYSSTGVKGKSITLNSYSNNNETDTTKQNANYWRARGYGKQDYGRISTCDFDLTVLTKSCGTIGFIDSTKFFNTGWRYALSGPWIFLNPSTGYFEAANAEGSGATVNMPIGSNQTYHVRIEGYAGSKTYDVYITKADGTKTQIVDGFTYRNTVNENLDMIDYGFGYNSPYDPYTISNISINHVDGPSL